MENTLHHYIEIALPYVISSIELMGIFAVTWTTLCTFWEYIQNTFMKKDHDLQHHLSKGLATGLEFKMAAEILKTVLVRDKSELVILGAVIILRALLSLLIHFEMKYSHKN